MKSVALAAALLVATPAFAELSSEQAKALSERVYQTLAPTGFAVAVVKDGELILAEGYGLRELGKRGSVNADTIFPLASVTKSMTAAALAMLVDEGKLSWDDRVIDHLPEFRLYDPWVTREFTIRDLLTHRSGLPLGAGDLLFWPDARSTRADVIKGLRYLKPETSFRTAFAYDNLLYIVAGEVVGAASGVPYERFVEDRLFKPLGMTRCRMSVESAATLGNLVTPHARKPGGAPEPISHDPDEPARAAGGAYCSARDLAKYAQFLLAGGVAPDGERLLSEDRIRDLFSPVTLNRTPGPLRRMSRSHLTAYALGWQMHDFEGELMAEHSGGGSGVVTHVALLPEKNAAAIALSNDLAPAPVAFVFDALEALADGEDDDWVGFAAEMKAAFDSKGGEQTEMTPPAGAAQPSLPVSAYAGTYRDPWYGDVHVRETDGGLAIDMHRSRLLKGPLVHYARDTFLARWPNRSINADAFVTFELDESGKVVGIRMKAASELTDFSYDYHHLELKRVDAD